MAEKVIVKGGGTLDGAQFDNAATEATLKKLLETVQKQKDGGGGLGDKVKEIANRALRENTKNVEDNSTAQKESAKSVGLLGQAASKTSSLISGGIGALTSGMVSGVVYAGEQFVKMFSESLDAFRQTSSVGANFNNDLIALRKTAAEARMPLEEFTAMVGNNSQLLAALGGTVTKGAQDFARLRGQLVDSDFGREMQKNGMIAGELTNYLSGYLEIQQRAGKIEGQIGKKELDGAQAYITEMDKMTKMTGVSRQESQNALRQAMKDGRSINLASKLSGQALLSFQSGLTLMSTSFDPATFKSLKNMMSGVIDPGDRFAKMLTNAVPGIMDFQESIAEGLPTDQIAEGYAKQYDAIDQYLKGFSKQQIARDKDLQQMVEYRASLKKFTQMSYADAGDQLKAQNALTDMLANIGQVYQNIKDKITLALLNSNVFGKLETVLKNISGKLMEFAPKIGDFLSGFIDDVDKAFSGNGSIMDGISKAFKSLFEKITPIVTSLAKDIFKGVMSAFSGGPKKEGGVADGSIAGGGFGEIDENPFEKIKSAINEIFPIMQPLQNVVEKVSWAFDHWGEILTGLAIGGGTIALVVGALSLLSKPIAIVAGAIGLGAAGLGALFWGLSKAIEAASEGLKSLPESLTKLSEVNGDKLKSAAVGIDAISVPLIKLGGGGILAALGGASGLGSVADALTKFSLIDINSISNLAEPLTTFHKALSLFTGGNEGLLASFGSAIGNWVKGDMGLTKFAESFKAFNDVKSDNIANLATGMTQLKNIGDDFSNQAAGVNLFTMSIKNLNKAITELNTSLASIAKEGKGTFGGGTSNLEVVSKALGGANATANTTANATSEKLNTLVTELITINKEIRDFNKDQADALSGRKNAL